MSEIESFIDWILSLVSENIYPGIFLASIIEVIFPPIPSEAIFPLAGYVVLKNEMPFFHVIFVGIVGGIGATLGATIIYFVAKGIGRTGLERYLKYGRIKKDSLDKADRWFERYGDKSVLVGRVIPGIRSIVSIPAGIFNMRLTKFLLFTFVGSCAWSIGLAVSGYYFGVATIDIL